MNGQNRIKLFAGVLVVMMVILACGTSPSVETTPTSSQDSIGIKPENASQPFLPGDLTRDQKSKLAHATVRIWGMHNKNGKLVPIYHGSGTILTPDGIILTNCHVADPVAMGYAENKYSVEQLVIEMVDTEDKPPVPAYLAQIIAEDPVLDLAVLQISSNLDGSFINKTDLKLPWVPMGKSEEVKFGDRIYIFGYPSIGGDTITYASGDVSGFDTEDPVGNRAWIKTEATIAGGNSGGLAANTSGEIIGIPTQIGTGSATQVTDCRFIQDTNGDGKIDDSDTCVPTGGFINGIRPVNWALPLIQAARNNMAYVSPYPDPNNQQPPLQPNPPSQPVNPGSEMVFDFAGWSQQVDQNNNCPTNIADSFPSGITKFYSGFRYQNIPAGTKFNYTWFLDGRDTATGSVDWNAQFDCFEFILDNKTEALPDGHYILEVYYNNQTVARTETNVGGTVPPAGNQQQGGVTLVGLVTDAYTGDPIADVYVLVLNPGVDPDAWREGTPQADVYSTTQTDTQGNFQIPDLLERGSTYGVVIGNKSLGYAVITGTIDVKQNDSDTINLPVELSK